MKGLQISNPRKVATLQRLWLAKRCWWFQSFIHMEPDHSSALGLHGTGVAALFKRDSKRQVVCRESSVLVC